MIAAEDPRHGTKNGYSHHGCRCVECRAANTATQGVALSKMRARPYRPPHGASRYTNYGCRCDVCRLAHNARCNEYQQR